MSAFPINRLPLWEELAAICTALRPKDSLSPDWFKGTIGSLGFVAAGLVEMHLLRACKTRTGV